MLESFQQQQPELMDYLARTWLPDRTKFLHACTKFHAHFGNTASSRVESAHAYIKRFIHIGTSDIRTAWQAISRAVDRQLEEAKARLAYERINLVGALHNTPMSGLAGQISHHAASKLIATHNEALLRIQRAQATSSAQPHQDLMAECECMTHFYMGVPCVHQMQKLVLQGRTLDPTLVHAQWWLHSIAMAGRGLLLVPTPEEQVVELLTQFKERFDGLPSSMKIDAVRRLQGLYDSLADSPQEALQPIAARGRPRKRARANQSALHPTITREPSAFEYA